MNTKIVKKTLKDKTIDWLATIEDKSLARDVWNTMFITGGAIVSILEGKPVNDFDVYLQDKEVLLKLAKYYTAKIKDIDIEYTNTGVAMNTRGGMYFENSKKKYGLVLFSKNAITLNNKIQITTRFSGKPAEVHENFDFLHCMHYWIAKGNYLKLNKQALNSMRKKKLVYVGSKYPVSSIIRAKKFKGRGWLLDEENENIIRQQVRELDLNNKEVYKEQTTGFYSTTHQHTARTIRDSGVDSFVI